jgi:hypothetical protein
MIRADREKFFQTPKALPGFGDTAVRALNFSFGNFFRSTLSATPKPLAMSFHGTPASLRSAILLASSRVNFRGPLRLGVASPRMLFPFIKQNWKPAFVQVSEKIVHPSVWIIPQQHSCADPFAHIHALRNTDVGVPIAMHRTRNPHPYAPIF